MDAVFGEGKTTTTCLPNAMLNLSPEELEERLEDEESERASLVSRRSSRSRNHSRLPSSASQGLVSRLMGRDGRASYQPINDDE